LKVLLRCGPFRKMQLDAPILVKDSPPAGAGVILKGHG
jgi:hypothetical protein